MLAYLFYGEPSKLVFIGVKAGIFQFTAAPTISLTIFVRLERLAIITKNSSEIALPIPTNFLPKLKPVKCANKALRLGASGWWLRGIDKACRWKIGCSSQKGTVYHRNPVFYHKFSHSGSF